MNLKKKFVLGVSLGMGLMVSAQTNTGQVLTGAPFLRIAPDARAGGMADQGVVTSPDAFSQFWNAAKYPFGKESSSLGLTYTPYMSKLTNDVFLLYGAYQQKIGDDNRSTISGSIYYFNMGEVELTDIRGTEVISSGKVKPNEFAIDVAYGLKLSDNYAMSVTGRYIRSDFGSFGSSSTLKPANTFAIDVSGYYEGNKHQISTYEGKARGGFSIQNLGPKLDYTGDENQRSYLPTTARLGGAYDLFLDPKNRISTSLEFSKILVPGRTETGVPNVGVVEGIGKSFSNPKSIMWSLGAEYSYDEAFAVRGGYFRESEVQGARQFATLGVGLKYKSFGLDISYLINTARVNTALDNTLRFGLTWNIGGGAESTPVVETPPPAM